MPLSGVLTEFEQKYIPEYFLKYSLEYLVKYLPEYLVSLHQAGGVGISW